MALFTPSITQAAVLDALGDFLLAILPNFTAAQIVIGQENRIAEAQPTDFIVMTPLFKNRLSLSNIDTYAPSSFTGSIAADLLTVSTVTIGAVTPGNQLFGVNVAPNTIVGTQASGPPGGAGTYAVSPSQTVASTLMASGSKTALMPQDVTVQLDIHGPGGFDNSNVVMAMFRDAYSIDLFAPWNTGITPLYSEDAIELTFENAEQQTEQRWIVSAHLQCNPAITIPYQFATVVKPSLFAVNT